MSTNSSGGSKSGGDEGGDRVVGAVDVSQVSQAVSKFVFGALLRHVHVTDHFGWPYRIAYRLPDQRKLYNFNIHCTLFLRKVTEYFSTLP